MIIRWCGHSYFIIEAGVKVAIDPHDGESIGAGMKTCREGADLVLVTHEHYDHNAVQVALKEGSVVIRQRAGEFSAKGVRVRGVRLFHDREGGARRGATIAYVIEVEGVRVAHLGDVGHVLDVEQRERIGRPDVLMVPVGGVYTIGPGEALQVIELLRPRIAIPMHYWLPGSFLPLLPLEEFLKLSRWRARRVEGALEVRRETLPEETLIVHF
ncbi:MAG: MBL fold metallo-hydrolase [Acidilobaceae archaeon]|nr:MBL fold metallo-hydrolase [Acidilobaceae archaeon]MCX8165645.1 MBL fold metallo-hydrolase [Acidilobaceae archaeon]MDW7974071.1 MBL fold metallo-hydrolase [Sulfolobales archaeon]